MSLEERIDTLSAAGELIFHVFGAIAHFERRLISERSRDGLQAAAAREKQPGRPRVVDEKIAPAIEELGRKPGRKLPEEAAASGPV